MKSSMKMIRCLACAAIASLAGATAAHAETLAQLVQDASGPTTAVFSYDVQVGSSSFPSGPSNNIPNLVNKSFGITGTPFFGTDTVIIDQFENVDDGTFSMNIDTAHPANDFLVEQIDFGSGLGTPSGLETVFNSTSLLGFGAVPGGFAGEYWFAFQQGGTATSLSPAHGIIGGIIQSDADIKVFAVSAPTPTSALGGLGLIVGLAGWRSARRFASKTA